jgi:pilus assembly protein Flp/PilA
MKHMRRKLWRCYSTFQAMTVQEAGQDLMEYAMVFAVIALAVTAGMQSVAGGVSAVFTTIGTTLRSAVS